MKFVFLVLGFLSLTIASGQRVITTVAGADWLFPGDGQPAKNAPIGGVGGLDVAFDSNGNYYVCDTDNYMVFRVTPDGIIHAFAGNGINFVSGDAGLAVNAAYSYPMRSRSTPPTMFISRNIPAAFGK
jgi:hypothetical protein